MWNESRKNKQANLPTTEKVSVKNMENACYKFHCATLKSNSFHPPLSAALEGLIRPIYTSTGIECYVFIVDLHKAEPLE